VSNLPVNGGCSCQIYLIKCSMFDCNSFPLSQLVDVYRLVEDQIDMPSVALEVLQGKLMIRFCLLIPVILKGILYGLSVMNLLMFFLCRFTICCT
jgi:hypothetical protein